MKRIAVVCTALAIASPALRPEKTLDAWLADPQKLIPGQMMNVQVEDAKAREDLVAFLRTLTK